MAVAALAAARSAHADFIVPANAIVSLNGGTLDLGCTDVIVAGTLQLGSGHVLNARNVTVQPGGTINGGSGVIELGGNWSNNGGFAAGIGTVRFRDVCAVASATISGNSTFAVARFVSAIGKNYVFAVGSTQTITGVLEISGTAAQPIQFRSAAPGQVAFINLTGSGNQQIVHVGVTDVWATGQWLAAGQKNEGGGGNANRWFGAPLQNGEVAVPTLAPLLQGVLAALLALVAGVGLRRRRASSIMDTIARRSRARGTRS